MMPTKSSLSYKSNVGASAYFGFITAKVGNNFLPKEKPLWRI